MKYIKKFNTQSEYNTYKNNIEHVVLSYIEEDDKINLGYPNEFIAMHNVTDISSSTQILGTYFPRTQIKQFFIDGVSMVSFSKIILKQIMFFYFSTNFFTSIRIQ